MVGEKKAQKDVEALTQSAISFLDEFENNEFVVALSNYLISRES